MTTSPPGGRAVEEAKAPWLASGPSESEDSDEEEVVEEESAEEEEPCGSPTASAFVT